MRINKFLAGAGLASRRKVEELIINGKIKVNGEVIINLAFDINENDKVEYNGKILSFFKENIYIMLNKPKCYISAVSDNRDRKTVIDLIKEKDERLFPVGRLDYNTEGLLLITNDGDFANNVMHPRNEIGKTYEVTTKEKLTHFHKAQIRTGILIDGVKTSPALVTSSLKINDVLYVTTITIFEGKNREVRNMFKELHLKVYNLKRIKIGNLELGNLKIGSYKYLTQNDINKIFN